MQDDPVTPLIVAEAFEPRQALKRAFGRAGIRDDAAGQVDMTTATP
jgi:hypothetical protein